MSVTALLRPPLVWLAMAEAALIAVAGGVAWHIWQERLAPAAAPVSSGPPAAAPVQRPRSSPVPGSPPAAPPSPLPQDGPTPGLRTDAGFLSRQMGELNRVEAAFEDLEWRVTRAVVDGIQRYLEGVVLPSIERSQGGRR